MRQLIYALTALIFITNLLQAQSITADSTSTALTQADTASVNISRQTSRLMALLQRHVQLRRSLEDPNLISKPAEFAYFNPLSGTNGQGVNSYFQLNGALGYNFLATESSVFSAVLSYNRNSGIKSPQNALTTGIAYELFTGTDITAWHYNLSASHKWDYQIRSRSAQVAGLITPINHWHFFNRKTIGKPVKIADVYKYLQLLYGVSAGVEYEYRYQVDETIKNADGHYLRPVLKTSLKIFPWYIGNRLALLASLDLRYDVAKFDSTYGNQRLHPMLETGIEYGVIKEKTPTTVVLSYRRGENPLESMPFNEFWSATLRIKI